MPPDSRPERGLEHLEARTDDGRTDAAPSTLRLLLVGAGAVLLCCIGPALISGGALSWVGARAPAAIAVPAAVVILATTLALVVRRVRAGRLCCSPRRPLGGGGSEPAVPRREHGG